MTFFSVCEIPAANSADGGPSILAETELFLPILSVLAELEKRSRNQFGGLEYLRRFNRCRSLLKVRCHRFVVVVVASVVVMTFFLDLDWSLCKENSIN